jgi:hypothetical protein
LTWVPVQPGDENKGFYYRARVDLELVADGEIIDLNRIKLPTEIPIIDKRKF